MGVEPENINEVLAVDGSSKWKLEIGNKMDSFKENNTWVLAELPSGKKALHNKWIYRMKTKETGEILYKLRLVIDIFFLNYEHHGNSFLQVFYFPNFVLIDVWSIQN